MTSSYNPSAPSYSRCQYWEPPSCARPSQPKSQGQSWNSSHADGNYVIAYTPEQPASTLKVVIYLHGFALGNPYFYQEHVYHLLSQGYYVIFVDYQQDDFQGSTYSPGNSIDDALKLFKSALDSMHITAPQTLQNAINNALFALQQLNLTAENPEIYIFGHSVGGFLSLSWVYGVKSATSPEDTSDDDPPVSLSSPSSHGLKLTSFQKELLRPKAIVAASPMTGTQSLPLPKELSINLSDLIPDSVPELVRKALEALISPLQDVLNASLQEIQKFLASIESELPPFITDPLKIAETGSALNDTPIVILLGADDSYASPTDWQNKTHGKSNWDCITSTEKGMYISQRYTESIDSDWLDIGDELTNSLFVDIYNPRFTKAENLLYPYHNQAVTNPFLNESQVPEWVQRYGIGGPGKLDTMRCNYIWKALDLVLIGTSVTALFPNSSDNMGQWTCSGKTIPVAPVAQYTD